MGSDPIQHPTLQAIWSRSWWIRSNPTSLRRSGDPDPSTNVGLGRVVFGLSAYFQFSWLFAMLTPILAVWTPCAFKLFYEIPKKLPCVFGVFVTVFVIFYILKIDKNDRRKFLFWLVCFGVFFVNFLVWFLVQILIIWF